MPSYYRILQLEGRLHVGKMVCRWIRERFYSFKIDGRDGKPRFGFFSRIRIANLRWLTLTDGTQQLLVALVYYLEQTSIVQSRKWSCFFFLVQALQILVLKMILGSKMLKWMKIRKASLIEYVLVKRNTKGYIELTMN